jgi:uncharacterized membrane protein
MNDKRFTSERLLHDFFEGGVIIKLIIAIGEVVLGILFYFVSAPTLNNIFFFLIGQEGVEQPRDLVWTYVIHGYQGLVASQSFWAFLFLSHGLVKIVLAWALLKNKLWAYPAAAAVFSFFAIYQTYTLVSKPTVFLTLFTAFDIIVIALVLHEYKHKKRSISAPVQH